MDAFAREGIGEIEADAARGSREDPDRSLQFHADLRRYPVAAIASAVRDAKAMMVICGLTPTQDGNVLASATQSRSTAWCLPLGETTLLSGSKPMRTVPIGWNAVSFSC